MLTTITTSNIMLKDIIQISNYAPRVDINFKSSNFFKTHRATINKLNTKAKAKTMSSSKTMLSIGILSKFITSISSKDSNLSLSMSTRKTSSNHNILSGTKLDKAAMMSLKSKARNEQPILRLISRALSSQTTQSSLMARKSSQTANQLKHQGPPDSTPPTKTMKTSKKLTTTWSHFKSTTVSSNGTNVPRNEPSIFKKI